MSTQTSYIWNTAENSTLYNQLTFGVFMLELAQNFHSFQSGEETFKLRLYVGHDGTMIRLASLLGFGKVAPLRWPALGSEIVLEVRAQQCYFVYLVLSIAIGLGDTETGAFCPSST
jgi:hypothetical protein